MKKLRYYALLLLPFFASTACYGSEERGKGPFNKLRQLFKGPSRDSYAAQFQKGQVVVTSLEDWVTEWQNANENKRYDLVSTIIQEDRLDVIKTLIEKGHTTANEGFEYSEGGEEAEALADGSRDIRRWLHVAILENKPKIVTYLLDQGANGNLPSSQGNALKCVRTQYRSSRGEFDHRSLQVLLKHGPCALLEGFVLVDVLLQDSKANRVKKKDPIMKKFGYTILAKGGIGTQVLVFQSYSYHPQAAHDFKDAWIATEEGTPTYKKVMNNLLARGCLVYDEEGSPAPGSLQEYKDYMKAQQKEMHALNSLLPKDLIVLLRTFLGSLEPDFSTLRFHPDLPWADEPDLSFFTKRGYEKWKREHALATREGAIQSFLSHTE